VQRARSVVSALGLDTVDVVVGDVQDIAPALGTGFDLAFTRFFLVHQPDPVHTMQKIGGLLRPGGWLVVHEGLRNPPPRSQPPLDALTRAADIPLEVVERLGAHKGTVDELPAAACAAGFDVIDVGGFFRVHRPPQLGFDLWAATLEAVKRRAVETQVASEQEVDELVATLHAAAQQGYDWVTSPFILDLTLRKRIGA